MRATRPGLKSELVRRRVMAVEFYLAIAIALGMTAVAGVLYYYMMFLEAQARQMKRRIAELERAGASLAGALREAREALVRREDEEPGGGEYWPETLDEGDPSHS